jgi:hypothetical protein
MYWFSQRLGMRFDRGTWIATFAPMSVGLGLWPALVILMFVLIAAMATNQIYTAVEKRQLREAAAGYLTKIRQLAQRRVGSTCADAMVP